MSIPNVFLMTFKLAKIRISCRTRLVDTSSHPSTSSRLDVLRCVANLVNYACFFLLVLWCPRWLGLLRQPNLTAHPVHTSLEDRTLPAKKIFFSHKNVRAVQCHELFQLRLLINISASHYVQGKHCKAIPRCVKTNCFFASNLVNIWKSGKKFDCGWCDDE